MTTQKRTLGEELGIPLDQLASHGGAGELSQSLAEIGLVGPDGDLLDLVDGHLGGPPQTLDDDLGADALLDVFSYLLENLPGQHHHGRRAVSYLGVL